MKKLSLMALGLALALTAIPMTADTSRIKSACLQSDRLGATSSRCSCIQKVANKSLTRSDRRLASKFFSDPHKAQEIRQSDRRSHEEFWKRYRAFGDAAQATCS